MISISPFRFEGNKLTIEPELLAYQVFKKVYDLDKNTNKELALKYFIYIYHNADQKVVPVLKGYSVKDAHDFACREAKLDLTFKPSPEIIEAILYYKDNFISPLKELSIKLLNTLQKNIKILSKVDNLVEQKLNSDNITPEQIEALLQLQKSVTSIISQLPIQIKALREIDIQLSETKNDKVLRRGGEELKESMMRNSEIEDD